MYTFLGMQYASYKCWYISLHINLSPLTISMFFIPLKLYYSKCGLRTSNISDPAWTVCILTTSPGASNAC